MTSKPIFPLGSTIYAVDQQGATFALTNATDQQRVADDERDRGAVALTTFTVTAPRAMTGDEAADYACQHAPETSTKTVLLAVEVETDLTGQDLHDALRFHMGVGDLDQSEADPSAVTILSTRLRDPNAAVALLTGTHDGVSLLVHVWGDGTGEVASRRDGRWGVPSRLTPAP